ncbi:MAG: threonylcarbamoyl-AMP synthase [Candidatus Sericytochromatia bacterium]|nr:threonylcarbamoyl-AMP synthase [Candidatus Tanganyikabacteria bacterium]
MRRLRADSESGIAEAAAAISRGEVVAFPTDTAYGLGADPRSAPAVDRIYAIKGRPREMPLILLAASTDDLAGWAVLSPRALDLASRHWPGPLTLVVPAGAEVPSAIRAADGSIGVRVPAHPAAIGLLARTGPLATTSANRSGGPSPRSADDVAAAFGEAPERPHVLLDAGATRHAADSTVLSLVGEPRILREGALREGDLR